MLSHYVAIAVGGTFGCWARYALATAFPSKLFPYATLAINVIGSFLMGLLFVWLVERLSVAPVWRAAIFVGGLGGFTTFSAFSLEMLLLIEQGTPLHAAVYALLSVALGLTAVFAGAYLARSL